MLSLTVQTFETMREQFCPSAQHRRAEDATAIVEAALNLGLPVKSHLDEFMLGFRDCANESLRYLQATTVTAAETGEPETSGRRLVNALRVHLIQLEAETTRRRSSDDVDEPCRSVASRAYLEERRSSRQPPRRRRRRRLQRTPVSTHPRRLHHFQELHCREEIQTVHSGSRISCDFSAPNWEVTVSTSDDSGCDKDVITDSSGVSVVGDEVTVLAGNEFGRENVDELRQCARQLSTLADHDVRVGRVLMELFQLMDSNDD